MTYRVRLTRPVQKALDALTGNLYRRVIECMRALADNPRPPSARKLSGMEDHWRVRVGDWRIVYTVRDRELIVLVLKIGHRREIYRTL